MENAGHVVGLDALTAKSNLFYPAYFLSRLSQTALKDGKDWGAGASGSPVASGPYWFLSSKAPSQPKGLPPILVFAVEVAKWSDGTAAPMHPE